MVDTILKVDCARRYQTSLSSGLDKLDTPPPAPPLPTGAFVEIPGKTVTAPTLRSCEVNLSPLPGQVKATNPIVIAEHGHATVATPASSSKGPGGMHYGNLQVSLVVEFCPTFEVHPQYTGLLTPDQIPLHLDDVHSDNRKLCKDREIPLAPRTGSVALMRLRCFGTGNSYVLGTPGDDVKRAGDLNESTPAGMPYGRQPINLIGIIATEEHEGLYSIDYMTNGSKRLRFPYPLVSFDAVRSQNATLGPDVRPAFLNNAANIVLSQMVRVLLPEGGMVEGNAERRCFFLGAMNRSLYKKVISMDEVVAQPCRYVGGGIFPVTSITL